MGRRGGSVLSVALPEVLVTLLRFFWFPGFPWLLHWACLKEGNLCIGDLGPLWFWLAISRMKRLGSREMGLP